VGLPTGALGRRRLGGRHPSPAGYIMGTIVWAKRASMAEGARLMRFRCSPPWTARSTRAAGPRES